MISLWQKCRIFIFSPWAVLIICFLVPLIVSQCHSLAYAQSSSVRQMIGKKCNQLQSEEATLIQFPSFMPNRQIVDVEGILMTPDGEGPFPIVLLLYSARGINPPECYSEKQLALKTWGYASLIIDSNSAGNIEKGRPHTPLLQHRLADVDGAISYLEGLNSIDTQNVALIGWSQGGMTGLTYRPSKTGNPLKVVFAYYPNCSLLDSTRPTPAFIFHGNEDSQTPISLCKKLAKRSDQITLYTYNEAEHFFDFAGHFLDDKAKAHSLVQIHTILKQHFQ